MNTNNTLIQLTEIATRIKELREIMGFSVQEMTEKTDVNESTYLAYESGKADIPFSFIHKCALAFGVEMTDLLEGSSARLSSYTVTRKGQGQNTAKEDGIDIANLAPKFKDKLAEPYFVKYEYSASQQNKPNLISSKTRCMCSISGPLLQQTISLISTLLWILKII